MSSLSEEQIIQGFHTLLQDSLAQARGEGLLSDQELESADTSIQIAAPSLALFFAALGSTGTPPSISSPSGDFVLTSLGCPPSFRNAFELWQSLVVPIQRLSLEHRYDLARGLCEKEMVSSPISRQVIKLASEVRGIALEILQRRTFQLRFRTDLNTALGSSVRTSRTSAESSRGSQFEPPPMYSEGKPTVETKRAYVALEEEGRRYEGARQGESMIRGQDSRGGGEGQIRALEHEENLSVIRETLYSAFADAIVDTPSILGQLSQGPAYAAKAFFASTCLAILEVAISRVGDDGVRVVQMGRGAPKVIGISETPPYLQPFLGRLIDDTGRGQGEEEEEQELRQLGNAINEMALGMTNLEQFRERQAEAFKVLASITSL